METITRNDMFLNAVATGVPANLEPITREEMFLAKAGGQDVQTPTPITRKEMFLQAVVDNAGGGSEQDHSTEDGLITRTLTSYTNDRVESVEDYAFYKNTRLYSVSFPLVRSVGRDAFNGCSYLSTASIPIVENIAKDAFTDNSKLKEIRAPHLVSTIKDSFGGCTSLLLADCGKVLGLETYCFDGCNNLKTIILRKTDVAVSLSNVNSLRNTPFATNGTGGTVYVPAALIESYKTATNWSALYEAGTCNFVAIEGSEYE